MRVGVLSDSHDHLDRIDAALRHFEQESVEVVIHAGDVVAPFAAKVLTQWNGPLYVVYGNNDGERRGLKGILPQIEDGPILIDCGGRRISVGHYAPEEQPRPADGVDVIIFGHSHYVFNERRNGILHLNPGECCGWVTGRATVAILDTGSLESQIACLD